MYVCVCVQVLAKNLLLVKLGLLALPAETLADMDTDEKNLLVMKLGLLALSGMYASSAGHPALACLTGGHPDLQGCLARRSRVTQRRRRRRSWI